MALVDVKAVAAALNLDERRVQQLVKLGMPRAQRGRYDDGKCLRWYVKYLQTALEKKAVPLADGSFSGELVQRVRFLKAGADLREVNLAKLRGELIPLADVESTLTDLVLTTKARIMAIAPRLAPELVNEGSRVMVQAKLEKSLKDALSYLAKSSPTNGQANPKRANRNSASADAAANSSDREG